MSLRITVRHWLPIVTICPVNSLPDLIYVSVSFTDTFVELYAARKTIRKVCRWRAAYMEDIARAVANEFPDADNVTVRLAFSRHVVSLGK